MPVKLPRCPAHLQLGSGGYAYDATQSPPACTRCAAATWIGGAQICFVYESAAAVESVPYYGLSEEECCCADFGCTFSYQMQPTACPAGSSLDPISGLCSVCNAHWLDGACRYGGLIEAEGIGANLDGDTHFDLVTRKSRNMIYFPFG